jgi:3-methyladenine DNA glycosylase AlkD
MTEQCLRLLNELRALSNEKAARIYQKQVVDELVLGCTKGPVRKIAKAYIPNHELGLELWSTNIYEARIMAIMILDPKRISIKDLDELLNQSKSVAVIDELTLEIFENFKEPRALFEAWIHHKDLMHQRAAWNSLIVLIHRKRLSEQEVTRHLDTIEAHLVSSPEIVKYAMNRAMVEIGINYPSLTQRILTNSERLGVYKEVMVAKGCTSPYAPDWIHAVLKRKG